MDRTDSKELTEADVRLGRRTLIRVATGGALAGGLLAVAPDITSAVDAVLVPNNFRALVHVTSEDSLQYAFSALETITEHYDKASAQLLIDGPAVKILATADGIKNVQSAKDAGAEIVAASDALQINGIDPKSLPDFIDASNTGVIAAVNSQVKGYHYYKV